MKYAILIMLTAFLAVGAWMGFSIGNNFMLYLFGLMAFAPMTAAMAVRANII